MYIHTDVHVSSYDYTVSITIVAIINFTIIRGN